MTSKPAPRKTADTISRMERESSTVMAFLLMTVLAFPDVIDVAVMISMMPVHDSSHASVPEGLARTDVDAEGLRIGMAPALRGCPCTQLPWQLCLQRSGVGRGRGGSFPIIGEEAGDSHDRLGLLIDGGESRTRLLDQRCIVLCRSLDKLHRGLHGYD